ncbi:hypothetical protein TNCV_627871 [Trichonephila clavipes]|nr:hypothetical protein TNCV_627871 [Trichonephila clavipes]
MICMQTKITSEEHLGWGIAGGLVNGTPVDKQKKDNFLSQSCCYWIPGKAVQDGLIEPLYNTVRLRM